MNEPLMQQAESNSKPPLVQTAVTVLWTAWAISACGIVANTLLLSGGRGAAITAISILLLHAVVYNLISKGNNIARWLLLVFVLLAIPKLLLVGNYIANDTAILAIEVVIDFSLRAVAVILLFTGASAQYFKKPKGRKAN